MTDKTPEVPRGPCWHFVVKEKPACILDLGAPQACLKCSSYDFDPWADEAKTKEWGVMFAKMERLVLFADAFSYEPGAPDAQG